MERKRGRFFVFVRAPPPPTSFFLFLLVILSSAGLSASQLGTPTAEFDTDRLAILSFKTLVSGPSGALVSWGNSSLHFCRWRGVNCRNHDGEPRVTALVLESLRLKGKLSPSLANLTFLRRLRLGNNSLEGSIPQELGFLSRLRSLNLSYNHLGGMIPTSLLQNCSELRIFSLSHNNLNRTIPRNLSNCLYLRVIDLDRNMLEGNIPSDIGSLPKLETVAIWDNLLEGSIPPEIGKLASLTGLHMRFNHLDGPIPAAIGNLSSLTQLDLSNNLLAGAIPAAEPHLSSRASARLLLSSNEFTGTIPPEIGKLEKVSAVFLQNNNLVGTIPNTLWSLRNLDALLLRHNHLEAKNAAEWSFLDALTNCTRLRILDLSINHLSGVLPKSVANLSKTLQWLKIHDNQIAGSIPTEIGNLSNLTVITILSHNNMNGTIPRNLSNCSELQVIGLDQNKLRGDIPTDLGSLPKLRELVMWNNLLQGGIPPEIGNLASLTGLYLGGNQLTGAIPAAVGNLSSLAHLDLSNSTLVGDIPAAIWNLTSLRQLVLWSNKLTGAIPSDIGNLVSLTTLFLHYNQLTGTIPSEIGNLVNLTVCVLGGNHLVGTIPRSLGSLHSLDALILVLDISSNDLSGHIPDFLGSFNMTYLNLSYNDLDGEVPKDGIFANASAFSVVGNRKLCGGIPELRLPSCPSEEKSSSAKLIAIVSVVGGILCVTFLISVLVACYRLRKSSRLSSVTSRIEEQHRRVSFAELLRATNEFSPANLIGKGSFGSSYRGIMDWEDHKEVAVKVLNLQQTGAVRSFMAECEALRNVRHRNLVKILTSCSGVDFGGNDFKALVFEFLPSGSLDEWLHPPERDERGSSRVLSLGQRLNISIDVASALDYLHRHVPTPIVHCDLKPSNVLLDDDMVAHVGDFGLARFVGKSSQRSTNSVTLKGSIGYAAPEYGMGHKVSVQGDVYSYGMLLLEMFTAKRPTDDGFKEGLNLHRYVERALPKHVVEIIDPNLSLGGGEGEACRSSPSANESSMRAVECIASVLRVGVSCSKGSPKERMQMEDVIRELHDIKDAFLGSTLLRA
ncbi:unnamed protein product [Musa acuminata subsp. malaccensis]|uniref:Receptor kinase-like protein Xa21 n=1 Tax=Musa acuminata subsp. malaccensis TaxID=214687 RepID=A0A8D6ZWY3_MUSAM|nr:unnamed protein product [Musa acuminata subsp. malaccensis]